MRPNIPHHNYYSFQLKFIQSVRELRPHASKITKIARPLVKRSVISKDITGSKTIPQGVNGSFFGLLAYGIRTLLYHFPFAQIMPCRQRFRASFPQEVFHRYGAIPQVCAYYFYCLIRFWLDALIRWILFKFY